KRILAFVSHALLSPKGIAVLMHSPIERLVTTDTVNNPWLSACDKVIVRSVSDMFANAIRIIHEKESLAELFE
ncbi:MAG: ribose-phosphate pyrophosphokinase, partial [Bacillota bacterium]|nr:ribose-phosphate pyrophosphokinase [Bacillota bacterium]